MVLQRVGHLSELLTYAKVFSKVFLSFIDYCLEKKRQNVMFGGHFGVWHNSSFEQK